MKGLTLIRCFSTSRKSFSQNSLAKMKKLQAEFQADDGRLVWEKRASDRMLATITFALCGIGIVMSVAVIVDIGRPPSWKEKN